MSTALWREARPAPFQGAFGNLTRLAIICLAVVATLSSFLALGQALGLRYWVTNNNASTGLAFANAWRKAMQHIMARMKRYA